MTLADTIKNVLETDDPRTIEEMIEKDQPSIYVIEESSKLDDDWYQISYDNGWIRSVESHIPIKVGDKVALYESINELYGLEVNGELVYYLTPMERASNHLKWLAELDRERRESYSEEREQIEKDLDSLPNSLRKRIERFESEKDDFWIKDGSYELFCCTEAAKFIGATNTRYVKDQEKVDKFWSDEHTRMKAGGPGTVWGVVPDDPKVKWLLWAWALNTEAYGHDYEKQKKILGMSDGHSNNTFGGAMQLAMRVLMGEEV